MLTIRAADLEALVGHCRRELPNEACGFLAGRSRTVEGVFPVRSTPPGPSRYAMNPKDQLRAMEEILRSGREIVGIYHSHPGGPDAPSSRDLAEACWPGLREPGFPGAVHVIVSLPGAAAPSLRGYALSAGAFVEVPIVVAPAG